MRNWCDAGLTSREQTVAQLAARGLTNKAMAIELGVFEGTVKVHMHSVFQKLRITSRWQLMATDQLPSTLPKDFAA